MGIGFVVFGYLFFSNFYLGTESGALSIDLFPDVLAWGFCALGCLLASPWSRKLKVAGFLSVAMILPSGVEIVHGLGFYPAAHAATFYSSVFPLISSCAILVFHYFLLHGLKEISDECKGEERLSAKLARNFYLTFFCFCLILFAQAMQSVSLASNPEQPNLVWIFSGQLCTMVYLIINEFTLVKFYRRITLA